MRPCKGRNVCVLLSVMIKECKGKTDTKVSDSQVSQACKGKPDAKVLTAKPARREITKPGTLIIVSLDNVIFNKC